MSKDETINPFNEEPEAGAVSAVDEAGDNPSDVASTETAAEPATEEMVVAFSDEPQAAEDKEHAEAPQWVKELRKSHREQQRQIKDLQRELDAKRASEKQPDAVMVEKPTLEDCDFDPDVFESRLLAWNEQKRSAEDAERKRKAEQSEADKAWQARLDAYASKKQELKVPGFEEAEAEVSGMLNQTQQGILIQYASNPASLVYALGNNEAKRKELASITDPILFAFAVRDLEAKVTVNKRTPPPPETKVEASGGIKGTLDSTLERLREEADRTGDFSKVFKYKQQIRDKNRN